MNFLQAVDVAKEVTGVKSETEAIEKFREILKDRKKSYFNAEKIPLNESDENAHRMCSSVEGAMKYCPKRWEALEKWYDSAREVRLIQQLITKSENTCIGV